MWLLAIFLAAAFVSGEEEELSRSAIFKLLRPGKYHPRLWGAEKYLHDTSGKYFHIHIPYDGGYGDTGEKYIHFEGDPELTEYDEGGWKIVQFKWVKDGKVRYSYLYETENESLAKEFARVINHDNLNLAGETEGTYDHEDDNGNVYKVDYLTNHNKGDHVHHSLQSALLLSTSDENNNDSREDYEDGSDYSKITTEQNNDRDNNSRVEVTTENTEENIDYQSTIQPDADYTNGDYDNYKTSDTPDIDYSTNSDNIDISPAYETEESQNYGDAKEVDRHRRSK